MSKRIEVLRLLEFANTQLMRTDGYATVGFKAGISLMIEEVLHRSDNYAGYGYVDNNDSECGTLGYYTRFYYVSNKLK
jgi:hypothetical protein